MICSLRFALVGALLLAGPASAQVVSGVASSSNPTPASGQPTPLSIDSANGGQRVSCVSGCVAGGGNITANQGTPAALTSTQTGGTVTTHLVFQSAIAANATRKGCTIQNTSTDIEYVFFGATGSATTSNTFQLAPNAGPGSAISCSQPSGVLTDNVAISSKTLDGATYVVNVQ